jgi:ABC-type sugar transport system ATPase subunit
MSATDEPVADLKNVWHRYGKQVALRGVSIELRAGG